jgi:hypothetical protein
MFHYEQVAENYIKGDVVLVQELEMDVSIELGHLVA